MAYPSNWVFTTLASDTFQRANENPLSQGGNWTLPDAISQDDELLTALQIVSNQCVPTSTLPQHPASAATYTGISWPTDQWVECVLGSSAGASILLRSNVVEEDGVPILTCYNVAVDGTEGTLSVGGGVASNSSARVIISEFGLTFNPGDVIRAVVMGQGVNINVSVYQNENLIGSAVDSVFFYASGPAGLAGPNDLLTTMSVTNFRGGFVAVAPPSAAGFSPNWLEGQQNAGLGIYVSPGGINGISVNGQVVSVPPNSSTYVWINSSGIIGTGLSLPAGVFPIALVVSGEVLTGTINLPNNVSAGILNITDIRQ